MFSDLSAYYLRWYHSRPVGICSARRDELRRLHRVLYRSIEELVQHYEDYVQDWGFSDKEWELLERQSAYPFRAGTYRPDYILSRDGNLLLCEITSRFFAHGIFMGWFGYQAGRNFCARFPDSAVEFRFPELMACMRSLADGKRRLYVLKSADRSGEIRLYRRFYEAMGLQTEEIEVPEVEARRKDWSRPDALAVNALNQRDLLGFSLDTLEAMMACGMVSELRNTFLIHDKRFLALWLDSRFTGSCLEADDAAFLAAHTIPTYLEMPADAYENKDGYILKPYRLGKSEGVMAGPLVSREQWQRRLDQGVEGCLFQPFIPQRSFPTVWEGTPFQDYLCGMMLCVDDRYFDSGFFRCSSLPVTNQGDDRKAFVLHTDDPVLLSQCDRL